MVTAKEMELQMQVERIKDVLKRHDAEIAELQVKVAHLESTGNYQHGM